MGGLKKMSRLSILIDVNKCNGCYNCFLTCRDEHYGNDYLPYSAAQPLNGQFWMQVKEIERGVYPKPKVSYIPIPCQNCEDAPCIDAAKDNAVYRREDGIVVIDPVKAKGQEAIVNACPYRVIYWNKETLIPQKCTFCAHRLDEGVKEPRCVEACPTGALVFGDLDNPNSQISKLAGELETEDFHPEFGTSPLVSYVGIPKRFIAGEVVLKDKQGECAQDVTIVLKGGGINRETVSDSYGDFEFERLENNTEYTIAVKFDGYSSQEFNVITRKDINLGEIVLEPQ